MPTVDQPPQYKDTLNLPITGFPMKAGAATREPEIQTFWETARVYERSLEGKARRFVLHDGPPYLSSSNIHIGTALNKVLKDIITRYHSMRGEATPYVPGYDGHGLPIENAVVKQLPKGREGLSPVELRQRCRAFADANLRGQEAKFRRLGVWGAWAHRYLTIDADFEATQIRLFADMYRQGFVYKGLKPVYWSTACETALAEAEVEYADHESHSIYVKFWLLPGQKPELDGAAFVIWTTTPWTLPSNVALAVNPEFTYALIEVPHTGRLIIAKPLLEAFSAVVPLDGHTVLAEFTGTELAGLKAQHPFLDRQSVVLTGSHVTLEAGTGIVHTAPGHGLEDYEAVMRYNQQAGLQTPLPVLSPIDHKGVFTTEAGEPFAGLFYAKANPVVIQLLQDRQALLHHSKFTHSYPHCWRSGEPVIYRATEQWFVSVDKFRASALEAIAGVTWIPARGENRISSMVANRSDWCISRQRVWGVPIPAFYCADCGTTLLNEGTIARLESLFREHTSDIWWAWPAEQLLGEPMPACAHCGGQRFTKETDIMDVWFDSGVTHTAVVAARGEELGPLPVDLYLEGSDQHRGWFQSSLLTSVMLYDRAPYKAVLTHGFVLDPDGRKMSKSLGNVVDPETIIQQYGADVLRLWVASVDYTSDVRIGNETIRQLTEVYKKVRNTIRYLLGNLADFDADRHALPTDQLALLDRYALYRLGLMTRQVTEAFDTYEFHHFYQLIQNFCVVDLSSLYLDVAKDILYCDAKHSPRRRAIQTVMHTVLMTLVRLMAPVMPHLAEDIWRHLPDADASRPGRSDSVLLTEWPVVEPAWMDVDADGPIKQLLELKNLVNRQLEAPRAQGMIGSGLECVVHVTTADDIQRDWLTAQLNRLPELFIVSQVLLEAATEPALSTGTAGPFTVEVGRASGEKCSRCWRVLPSVGRFADHPSVCDRCYEAVTARVAV